MDLDLYINKLRKNKKLHYYPEDILNNNFNIPISIRNYIKILTGDLSYLIKYIYNNFYSELCDYLNVKITKADYLNFWNRFDLFFSQSGPKVLEFNFDVAGGFREVLLFSDMMDSKLFLKKVIKELNNILVDGNIYILSSTSCYEDYQIALLIKDIINEFLGKKAEIISPVQLYIKNNYFYDRQNKIDNLIRYYPLDRLCDLEEYNQIRTNIINSPSSFLFQQKSFFSFLWDNFENFPKNIKKIIKQYIPYTTRDFTKEDLMKKGFVLKHINEREGKNIYILDEYLNKEFLYKKDLSKYILQEKIEPMRVQGYVLNFGVYMVNLDFAGIYIRGHKTIKTDINAFPVKFSYI